jgi:lipoate-protein ligase A
MGLDEAILVYAPQDSLILRFYRWAGPAVTFGYSQLYVLAQGAAQARGLDGCSVVRRATGGGVVFHDGDFTFSLCFPWSRLSSPSQIYETIHKGAALGLKAWGFEAQLWRPSGKQPVQHQCFTGPEPFDLVDGRKAKVLGGALRRRNGRGLYQGSLRLPAQLKAARRPELESALTSGLAQSWGRKPSLELEPEWLRQGEILAEKYRSDAWNHRR